jgi:tetratricopeptide (TPR) repeat protein
MNRASASWTLALLLALSVPRALAQNDTIVMVDGLTMEGKIHEEAPDYVVMLVHEEAGRVKVPRQRIKSIEYDYPTKAAALAEDDYKGHYELGVWAFQRGKYAEAVQELEKAKGRAGAGDDLLKLLAQAQDRTEDFQAALASYREYLQGHPDDAEVAKRVEELSKSFGAAGADGAPPKPAIAEGLEASHNWVDEKWDNADACFISITLDPNTGNKTLAMQAAAGAHDKVAFSGNGPNPLDLTGCKEMICRMYQTGEAEARIATAFINQDGDYYETREQRIPPKQWTTHVVPLAEKNFKSAKTNWAYTADLQGRGGVTRITFLVYGRHDLTLYLDSIFFR